MLSSRDPVTRWADELLAGVKRPSSRRVAAAAMARVLPLLGGRPIGGVTPADMIGLSEHLSGLGLSGHTQHAYWQWACRVLRLALEHGAIEHDPSARVRPRLDRAAIRPALRARRRAGETTIGLGDVRALVAFSDGWEAPAWALMGLAGLRLSEALGLRWEHVLERAPLPAIVVAEQRTPDGVAPPKTGEEREIPMVPFLAEWLGRRRAPHAAVIRGAPCHRTVARALERACERLDLPRLSPHDLRASFITNCDALGLSRAACDRWTHRSPIFTAASVRDRYSRAAWETQCAEAMKLEAALGPPSPV